MKKNKLSGPPLKPEKNPPGKPEKYPDPSKINPGINEPDKEDQGRIDEPVKNDPTRIDDPPPNND